MSTYPGSGYDEPVMCPDCKEWTTVHENCCGVFECDCDECNEEFQEKVEGLKS